MCVSSHFRRRPNETELSHRWRGKRCKDEKLLHKIKSGLHDGQPFGFTDWLGGGCNRTSIEGMLYVKPLKKRRFDKPIPLSAAEYSATTDVGVWRES